MLGCKSLFDGLYGQNARKPVIERDADDGERSARAAGKLVPHRRTPRPLFTHYFRFCRNIEVLELSSPLQSLRPLSGSSEPLELLVRDVVDCSYLSSSLIEVISPAP